MTTFATRIRPFVQAELDAAAAAEARGHFDTAFRHLERAHVLGQPSTAEHVRVHWRMARFAVRQGNAQQAVGQAWRLVAAVLLTAIGFVPRGNTGGADVPGWKPLPIAPDLQQVIDSAGGDTAPRARWRYAAATAIACVAAATAVGMAGCSSPPKDLDLALDKPTNAGTYRVALVPPAQAPAINQMHSWTVKLATPQGEPVHGATFAVDGGMPQHGHGLPTKPRVTRELADGSYQIDGMKFSMTGWWEVKLDIRGPQGADQVTFNTVVHPPVVRQ